MDPDQSQTSEAELIREREAELGPRRAGGMDPDKEAEPTPFLERRMPSSPFPAIADYAFLSDCHTGALVAPDGTIEWLCPPRFDSPSVFAALLDRSAGGWRFGPSNMGKPVGRRYEPGTNIVETTWMTPTGWMIVRDALILGKWRSRESTKATAHTRPPSDFDSHHVLVRTARCVHGTVHLEQVCEPVFGYGSRPATWSRPGPEHGIADASDGETTLRLHSDVNIGIEGGCARARRRLDAGEGCFFALSWSSRLDGPDSFEAAEDALDTTSRFWRTLACLRRLPRPSLAGAPAALGAGPQGPDLHAHRRDGRGPDDLASGDSRRRAQLGLPLHLDARRHLHAPGPARARPELGGRRLHPVRRRRRAQRRRRRCRSCTGSAARSASRSRTLDHLTGYEGARPVRVGNGAFDQRQNDVYGAVLDSIYLHQKEYGHNSPRLWPVIEDQARCAAEVWRGTDQGIWEMRGEPHHYVSSKVMCWVALDRAARLAARRGYEGLADEWRLVANEIHADVLANGVDSRGVFTQHYDTDALDASNLLVPLVRFLPQGDERVRATVLAIADELTENGLVLRYKVDETDDGLSGRGGDLPDLLVLARLGPARDRRAQARPRALRAAAQGRQLARPLRRGARGRLRPPPRQLPPGLHPPRPDQRRHPRDPRRTGDAEPLRGPAYVIPPAE